MSDQRKKLAFYATEDINSYLDSIRRSVSKMKIISPDDLSRLIDLVRELRRLDKKYSGDN